MEKIMNIIIMMLSYFACFSCEPSMHHLMPQKVMSEYYQDKLMVVFCVSADGRWTAQLLLLHFCEQVPERGVPGNVGRDHQQPVTKIQGGERQASPLPPEMTVPHNRHNALKSPHITSHHITAPHPNLQKSDDDWAENPWCGVSDEFRSGYETLCSELRVRSRETGNVLCRNQTASTEVFVEQT